MADTSTSASLPAAGSKRRRAASSTSDSHAVVSSGAAASSVDAGTGVPDVAAIAADFSVRDAGAEHSRSNEASNDVGDATTASKRARAASSASAATDNVKLPVAGSGVRYSGPLRGLPVSSRPWKKLATKRTSAASRPSMAPRKSSTPFKLQKAEKSLVDSARQVAARLKAEQDADAARIRAAREEKRRRRAANELRSTSYQEITDPAKLKRMSKKQLRNIKKTRMEKDGTVRLVPAYS